MSYIFAETALLGQGWCKNVRIGMLGPRISTVEINAALQPGDETHAVIVPGLCNLHSHAFQRAMAALAEVRGAAGDSFWSWRKTMYDFALAITPDQLEAVGAQLYIEMLETGFTRVGEFHYLHHDLDGSPYADISELAQRIAAASETSGISLTLLPVFYAHSGFGGKEPQLEQRRFINSIDSYHKLVSASGAIVKTMSGGKIGLAPHSLRAVTPEELSSLGPLIGAGPIHIHIAEQVREVEECIAWSGARPVDWLLDNAPVSQAWTLIHATHMNDAETSRMAARGAIAGLCPVTEANLGDGIFSATEFLQAGGSFGIGSDSNILVSIPEELRQLEYSQRLLRKSRNVIAAAHQSVGERLFNEALRGGGRSLQGAGHIETDADADIVSLDVSACDYLPPESALDQWIFGRSVSVDTVWARGRKRVEKGRHLLRDFVSKRFKSAMRELLAQMG
jgi:formimidoylglutamate deiminase